MGIQMPIEVTPLNFKPNWGPFGSWFKYGFRYRNKTGIPTTEGGKINERGMFISYVEESRRKGLNINLRQQKLDDGQKNARARALCGSPIPRKKGRVRVSPISLPVVVNLPAGL